MSFTGSHSAAHFWEKPHCVTQSAAAWQASRLMQASYSAPQVLTTLHVTQERQSTSDAQSPGSPVDPPVVIASLVLALVSPGSVSPGQTHGS